MNEYRITVDNKEECEVSQVTVKAESLGRALFMAGVEAGRRCGCDPGALVVVKAETPAGWIEVEIL